MCFVKTSVELHLVFWLHRFDCFCTVHTCVSVYVGEREGVCVVCTSVCIGILSVTSKLLSYPPFIGGGTPPKILYCLLLVGYSNFSLF